MAFAACFDTNGALVDVSNNVGDDGTNEVAGAFEVAPFAVGRNAGLTEGQLMPEGSQLTFEINLSDPLIYGYVQAGLDQGNLSVVASSLVDANYFAGTPNWPSFYTIFSALAEAGEFPVLDIAGRVARPCADPAPRPEAQVVSIRRDAGGTELRFTLAPSRAHVPQWSEDLRHWQAGSGAVAYSSAWLAKTGTNAVYPAPVFGVWRDTNAAGQQRFYRIEIQ